MGYRIEAFLQGDKPSLKIYDIKNQNLCLSWTYCAKNNQSNSNSEVQRLFRELILLTCKQDIHNVRVFNLAPEQIN